MRRERLAQFGERVLDVLREKAASSHGLEGMGLRMPQGDVETFSWAVIGGDVARAARELGFFPADAEK